MPPKKKLTFAEQPQAKPGGSPNTGDQTPSDLSENEPEITEKPPVRNTNIHEARKKALEKIQERKQLRQKAIENDKMRKEAEKQLLECEELKRRRDLEELRVLKEQLLKPVVVKKKKKPARKKPISPSSSDSDSSYESSSEEEAPVVRRKAPVPVKKQAVAPPAPTKHEVVASLYNQRMQSLRDSVFRQAMGFD